MLIRFRVSNFLSVHEEVELSLIAGRVQKHPTHVVKGAATCNLGVLRAALIYGANASGKSNLIKAIHFAQRFIQTGSRVKQVIPRIPFKLCRDATAVPSKFEFEFKQGEICYIYGFKVDHQRVREEWLYEIKKTTEMPLFERTTTPEGKVKLEFGRVEFADKKEEETLEFVARGTRSNQLFLTESVDRNVPHFVDVYRWFDEVLTVIYPESHYVPFAYRIAEKDFAGQMAKILEQLGTGISGFELLEVNPAVEFPGELLEDFREHLGGESRTITVSGLADERYLIDLRNGEVTARKLMFKHKMGDCDQEILLDGGEESDGTRRLMDLLPGFADFANRERVLVIDELDRSLHPRLSYDLLKLFLAEPENTSQIIATTHEENLLDLELLRRDEIWFIEKDQTGASRLYSLEEFAPRYDKDIERGYLMGRFGAIPVFGRSSFVRRA